MEVDRNVVKLPRGCLPDVQDDACSQYRVDGTLDSVTDDKRGTPLVGLRTYGDTVAANPAYVCCEWVSTAGVEQTYIEGERQGDIN